MREILFRGKCQATGQWVYGLPLTETTLSNSISHIAQYAGDERRFGRTNVMIIPESVSQFTGLLDKNGNKIFESHKIKYNNWIGVVKYSTGAFYICYGDGTESEFNEMSESDLEIIGNIHETNK